MEVGDLLLQGDDSTWKASDWHWDSRAFVAAPKEGHPDSSTCCKKRKTETLTGVANTLLGSCGGCKAAELAPLKFFQQTDNSSGSSLPKVVEAPQHNSASSTSEAVALARGHEASCQADGCQSDMATQSVWHQKSKICDKHMSGMFLKLGRPQQFCQQCGRSHNLDAFDQGRKSCRTQLAKHAARRRKRYPAATSKPKTEDTSLVNVAGPPMSTGCKAGASIAALAMQHPSSDAWLQNLCNNQQASEGLWHAQPLEPNFRHSSGSSDQSMSNSTSFAHNRVPLQADEHTSFPAYDQPAVYTVGTGCANQTAPITQQPACPSVWVPETTAAAQGLTPAPQDDPLQDVLNWQLPPIEESSRPPMSGFEQALAFMQAGGTAFHPPTAFGHPQQQPAQQQPSMHIPGLDPSPNPNASGPALSHMGFNTGSNQALPSYQGMPMAAQQQQQQPYTASNAAVRVSVKLFNCTPAQLPSNLRESVTGWLGSTPAEVEGYIRPGCVHLTVQATVPAQSHAQSASQAHLKPQETQAPAADLAVKQVVDHLLASSKQDIWHKSTMVVQLGSQLAVVHKGAPLKVWNIPAHAETDAPQEEEQQQSKADKPACCILAATRPSRLPVLTPAQPVCLVAGMNEQQAVTVIGGGLSQDCKVRCRAGGQHLEVQVLEAKSPSHQVQVVVPCNLPAGVLYLEVHRGSFMGPALPLMVAPTASLAAEAVCMLHATLPSDQQGLTVDLGCAMLRLTACNKLPRHGAGAVSEEFGSFQAASLLAVLARAVSCGQIGMVKSLMSLLPQKDSPGVGVYRDASGMGLLHLAVRSGSLGVLATLLEDCNADAWQDGIHGPAGITPFHLAAFLPDTQPVALLLCTSLGAHHWFTTTTRDGHTPADFAVRCGNHSLSHAISKSLWKQASANCAGSNEKPGDQHPTTQKATKSVYSEEPHCSVSTCTGCSSDSSSSSDDSGSDLDASQHGGSILSVMPNPGLQSYPILSAATNFVRDSKERLAGVIRKRWSPY